MTPRMAAAPGWPYGAPGQSLDDLLAAADRFEADWPATAENITKWIFARPGDAAELTREALVARILARDPAKMAALWRDMARADFRDLVRRLDVPLHAFHGARTRAYPPGTAEWLAANAPRGRAVAFAHSGHIPHLEEPDRFAEAIAGIAG
jgi:Predicted hydrolases or acyltransferases (alpha/beta hydrolase superfamily)